jgi:hypothetical protein
VGNEVVWKFSSGVATIMCCPTADIHPIQQGEMMDKETLLMELHKQFGICGVCGSHTCNGRASYSDLPEQINTRKTIRHYQ